MKIVTLSLAILFFQLNFAQDKVLVYYETASRANAGFTHSSIDDGISMIEDLGEANGLWTVDTSDDSSIFTNANLGEYNVVVWCNTSGNGLLTNNEQQAFEDYIEAGGGFVGIHAATDTYRDGSWPFYNELVGGIAQTSPRHTSRTHNNTMDVNGSETNHPSVEFLNGDPWNKTEEYYYWSGAGGELFEGNNDLLIVRETGNNSYDEARPISWYKEYRGGRSFYTAMGHNDSDYTDDQTFIRHIEEAIKWAGKFEEDTEPFVQLIENGDYILQDTDLTYILETDADTNNTYTNELSGNVSENQVWTFEHQGNNLYSIQNLSTNWYLETPTAACGDGVNVATWRESTQIHHQFKVIAAGNQYLLEGGHCADRVLSADRNAGEQNVALADVEETNPEQLWEILDFDRNTLSIDSLTALELEALKFYPNPVVDMLTIEGVPQRLSNLTATVHNFLGAEVKQVNLNKNFITNVDLSLLSSGVYFVKFSNAALAPVKLVKK